MYLYKIANIIYEKDTASENTPIVVKTHHNNRVLWIGKAKELKNWNGINKGWIVSEILIDTTDRRNIPDYNKGKIIVVI